MLALQKADFIAQLQTDIIRLEGFKTAGSIESDIGLGPIKNAFPNNSFPTGCIHEFLSPDSEGNAASIGFIAGLLTSLMGSSGTSLWISSSRTLFPPALKNFGIQPDRFIFLDLQKEKDVVWAMDEALKCGALTAVIGEMREISFKASRRLQLAVEQSKATGFVINRKCMRPNTTACVSRWKITSLPSTPIEKMPGIGFPKWRVELLRIRNGRPGAWDFQWVDGKFQNVEQLQYVQQEQEQVVKGRVVPLLNSGNVNPGNNNIDVGIEAIGYGG